MSVLKLLKMQKKNRLLFDLLIDIEKKMIEFGEISPTHAIIVSKKSI